MFFRYYRVGVKKFLIYFIHVERSNTPVLNIRDFFVCKFERNTLVIQ